MRHIAVDWTHGMSFAEEKMSTSFRFFHDKADAVTKMNIFDENRQLWEDTKLLRHTASEEVALSTKSDSKSNV